MAALYRSLTLLSLAVLLGSFAPATKYSVPGPVNPQEALQRLLAGNERFVQGRSIHPNQTVTRLKEVAAGQSPFAVIVGCSDSRVPNEIIFDQGLGDLFIVRTAGQVSTYASWGSIEFGNADKAAQGPGAGAEQSRKKRAAANCGGGIRPANRQGGIAVRQLPGHYSAAGVGFRVLLTWAV